ncbi:MAG TPA: methyl-accepting chemotaxis protein, partial [Spirochaetota bacterium]|nr:methyl-accepting chemotaxis protein [Spirochaetota bacterium]
KMVIPILSGIMILLIFAAVGIYRISYNQTYEMYSSNISARVQKNSVFIGSLFEKTAVQLRAYAKASEIRNMNLREMSEFLKNIHEERGGDIEMYFAANLQGNAPNSLGETRNISDREYFKRVTGIGVEVYSDPVVNKQTGRMIMVAAVPVKSSTGKTVGMIGATILLDRMEGVLTDEKIIDSGRFLILSGEGKVLFHPDRSNIGKVIGKDVIDDGKKIKNISRLLTESENRFFGYTFSGKDVLSYKTSIPLVRQMLIFTMDRNDFVNKLRYILIELLAALVGLALMLYLMIRYIAKRFSLPIQNTIGVLERLAEGDLTAESTDFLADEFGEMIRNFKQFQRKLRGTITTALKAAVQLSSSAHELAITSSKMSDSAQTQAASVEEASASLEEVSGSIELININAQEQAKLAKTTYNAMEQLRSDNETVAGYAEKALEAARGTTEQAGNGQQLMQNTIEGMNNIDESTQKIADTVRLISDISDQVNLLALNASIEAARAGEHGRGFAVVAEEISKLADQTAASAKGITDFVNAGLREVEKGRSYVDETGRAFNMIIEYIAQTEELVRKITDSASRQAESSREVLESTKKVNEMSDSISVSTNEQMMTNQEMSKTVEQINQNTQAAAAAAEEIASSADEISAQAEILSARMEFFKV